MATVIVQDYNVTNRELSRWLAEGNGEVCIASSFSDALDVVRTRYSYLRSDEDEFIPRSYRVRKWCDVDWRCISRSYMGL